MYAGTLSSSKTGESFIGNIQGSAFTSNSTAVDSSGNSYHIGASGLIVKLNSRGDIQWQVTWSAAQKSNGGNSLYINSSNQLVVCGADSSKFYVMVLNTSTAAIVLQKELSVDPNFSYYMAVHVDSNDNIYLAGSIDDVYRANSVLIKLNSSGTLVWARELSPVYSDLFAHSFATGVGTDSSSNVYIMGSVMGSDGGYDGYLIKYNSSGTLQWQRKFDANYSGGAPYGVSMNVDSSGNCYVVYDGLGTIVGKVNSSGSLQWSAEISDQVFNSTYDGTNLYLLSTYSGTHTISKINGSTGALILQRQLKYDTLSMSGAGIGHHSNHVYLSGRTGTTDINYLAKLPDDGSELGGYLAASNQDAWRYTTGSTSYSSGLGSFWTYGTSTSLSSATWSPTVSASSTTVTSANNTYYVRKI